MPPRRLGFPAFALACALYSAALVPGAQAAGAAPGVEVAGTLLRVRLADGRWLQSPDLVGAILTLETGAQTLRVRLDRVERDATDEAIWWHVFSVEQPDGGWRPFCAADPQGRARGFPLAGRMQPGGTLAAAEPGSFELVCATGTAAKCVLHGYRPWRQAPDGQPLQPAHEACTRMLRADYTGDGRAATRDGTLVGFRDRWGLHAFDEPVTDAQFEAGWDAQGAVCVRRHRLADGESLAALEARTPRLRGRTGEACTPALARSLGALVWNWTQR